MQHTTSHARVIHVMSRRHFRTTQGTFPFLLLGALDTQRGVTARNINAIHWHVHARNAEFLSDILRSTLADAHATHRGARSETLARTLVQLTLDATNSHGKSAQRHEKDAQRRRKPRSKKHLLARRESAKNQGGGGILKGILRQIYRDQTGCICGRVCPRCNVRGGGPRKENERHAHDGTDARDDSPAQKRALAALLASD